MWQNITALMPPHSVYIETHLGGGAIMRNKRPATRNIGVDVDPLVIEAARGWGMSDLQLVEQDAVRFLNSFNFQGGELVYVDPPYLSSTKKGRRYYRHEYTDEDHGELLETICELPCYIMISGYPSSLYEAYLGRWNHRDFPNVTHGGVREERVWANFVFGAALHDYKNVGATYRERERIRRKITRWRDRLASMPHLERNAIMAALLEMEEIDRSLMDRIANSRRENAG